MPKGAHLRKHGLCYHPLYGRWRGMVQRCTDPNYKAYKHYGGRGIKVCERWREFPNFLADMGMPKRGESLDRIDPNGHYEPGNCRWVSQKEQMRNTRHNWRVTFNGKTQCLQDWAKELGLCAETLKYRLEAKWPMEQAMTSTIYNTRRKAL